VLAAILSPLLFLGLLEAGLRIGGFRYEPATPMTTGGGEMDHGHLYRPDPDLLWTLHPRRVLHDPMLGFIQVRTNSLGLRGPEPPGRRHPGGIRILCLGDSITFGLGVGHGRSWPRQLERILREREELAGRPVNVVNGAVPGWSSVQGMQLLRRLEWLHPTVIVFWFGPNDVQYRGARDACLIFGRGLRQRIASALSRLRIAQLVQYIAAILRPNAEQPARVSRREFAATVKELEARAANGGPHVIFVRCPDRCASTVEKLERILDRAEETGVKHVVGPIDLLSPITPARPGASFVDQIAPGPDGPELHLAGPMPIRQSVAEIRSALKMVRGWTRALAWRLDSLPEGSPGYSELFGDAAESEVFLDNFHLTARGNRLAAEALAERILPLLIAR
jgi:lysophospholipase L1-like esterase